MKEFFGAGMLLTLFTVIALSFCVFSFGVNDNPDAPLISVHQSEGITEALPHVHVTFGEQIAEGASRIWRSVKEATGALPFFAVDAAERIYGAAKDAALLFESLFNETREDGALMV